jgi:hypothetical protein
MALPPPQDPTLQPASRDLPAAYRNPWQSLRDDLEAVVADLRLRSQELWRRNGQGSLWRPGWWPSDLAPLFWPLVLGLAIALSAIGIAAAATALRGVQPDVAASRSAVGPVDQDPGTEQRFQPPADQPEERLVEGGAGSADAITGGGADATADAGADLPRTEPEEASSLDAAPPAEPETPQAPVDPLAELVQRPEADGLLKRAQVLPDQVTLQLQVSDGFERLPAAEQQQRAVQWQQWATDLGYDHLELRDSRAGLLARDALVGSGMIVLSESSRP